MRYISIIFALVFCTAATSYTPGGPNLPTTITLTCSVNTTLSGTYNVDEYMMTLLNSEVIYYIANGSTFPNATQVPAVTDTSDAVHSFASLAALESFYKAVAGMWIAVATYQNRLNAGQSPTYPSNTSSAC